jgi:hypothetical protein
MTAQDTVDDTPIAAPNSGSEPSSESAVGEFNIKVSLNGVPLGWFTDNGSPEWWITVVPQQSESTTWTQVSSSGGMYLQKSTNNYLSYRVGNPYATGLKMRAWVYAAKWQLDGKNLLCVDNGKLVGRDGDSFYANGENVVEVEFISK